MDREARAALERAKARLDRLALYPRPVDIDPVRIVVAPWFFRLPRFRRYRGYAFWRTILLRDAPGRGASDDLLCHELCHIWQGQNRPLRVLLAFFTTRYRKNPFEIEARQVVAQTREVSGPAPALQIPKSRARAENDERQPDREDDRAGA